MSRKHWTATVAACVVALSVTAMHAEAQFPLTLVAGPTFTKITGDDAPDDVETRTGFLAGVATNIPLSGESVALTPAVVFVQRGWKETDTEAKVSYIDIPVFVALNVPVSDAAGLLLSAGPRISFQMSCTRTPEDGESADCPDEDGIKSTDFGVLGDAGFGFSISPTMYLGVGAGYDFGLTEIFDNFAVKNSGVYFYGALTIILGG